MNVRDVSNYDMNMDGTLPKEECAALHKISFKGLKKTSCDSKCNPKAIKITRQPPNNEVPIALVWNCTITFLVLCFGALLMSRVILAMSALRWVWLRARLLRLDGWMRRCSKKCPRKPKPTQSTQKNKKKNFNIIKDKDNRRRGGQSNSCWYISSCSYRFFYHAGWGSSTEKNKENILLHIRQHLQPCV